MGPDELSGWRDALIVDRDDALIGAAKRWLGPVKTPFNKHELVAQIESFLRRRETSDAMVALLDRTDRRILALALYSGTTVGGGLPQADLAKLAADDSAFEANALERIRNLKERLALYTYRAPSGRDHVAVAPPLAARLASELSPSDALAIARPTEEPEAQEPFAAFCAVVSASVHAKPAFKGKKEPSRKAADILESAAPGLSTDKERLSALIGALEVAGIFGASEDGRPVAYPRRFVERCDGAGDTAPLALAAACSANRCASFRNPAYRCATYSGSAAKDRRLSPGTLRAVLQSLPRGLAFSPPDLRRLVAMAARRYLEPLAGKDAAEGSAEARETLDHDFMASVEAIAEALGMLGFVVLGDDGLVRATSAAAAAVASRPEQASRASVAVEESHEIRILPEAGPAARAFVSSIARLERTGLVWSATLDRAAAKTAYAYGFGASEISGRLEELSGLPLPQSVRFSLEGWEAESRSARLRTGVVVALDGHLSGVLEHSPKAAGLVLERLAEGVYLLAARDASEAERQLKAAGIDVDMRAQPDDDDGEFAPLWSAAGIVGSPAPGIFPLAFSPLSDTLVSGDPPLVARLIASLDGLPITPDERTALEERIRSRLVLDESELKSPPPPESASVAGALDYPGKLRLLERALKDGAEVEVGHLGEGGKTVMTVGVPRDIRRTAAGMVVALSTGATEQSVVPIGAIEIVRRR
ncbi:MAG: hypothetical protein KKA67_06400 [Spirochaetes bacterium]|nr:hypothetical protein [Spirochaetota bacterium]MBU1082052.1 hypothetical protein [Spirochaetota bacterium]